MMNIFAPIASPLIDGLNKPFGFFASRLRPSQSFMAPCLMGFTVTCLLLSGCAGTKPLAYSGIASAPHMRSDAGSDRLPFTYTTPVNWRDYSRILIEPVVVYHGPDAQFGKIPEQGKVALASYMQEQFTEKLSPPFELTETAKPRTLRLRLTLTGAKPTMPVAGSFSRIDIAGGPYNMVQAIRGKEGSLTGSVFYAVEIYDASTNRLLAAHIVKQYPAALNMKATFGALTAAKTGIRKGAEELAKELNGQAPSQAFASGSADAAEIDDAPEAIYDPQSRPQPGRKPWRGAREAAADPSDVDGEQPTVYPICKKGEYDHCRQRGGK
jgi:hypothetical protein